ncbi:hypothetical protein SARC_11793 [Sphaeroforma arctica JP610]|uniref:Uncharacterized protein n=1 Tax=Sphaeroforma arctica JP610 TaxID=667725 RepID=A0A0L0FFZ4_9EUKA|nr:hypothetical protein SARC_11793 [Sphaeroforma arctica JP610]KNC75689.1 hypothetical protein SARC_11793 [Sphaeroforma arctica JP610]|eukprot:XP_014149591.1 hypothetical protein SARC_11793 [Sphaeroforma arctica JP610]
MSHVSSAAHPLTHIPQAPGGATTEVGSSHPKKKRGQSKSQQMEMAKDMDTSAALKRMEERLSVHDKKFEAHDLALDELKSRVAQLEFLTKLLWIAMAAMVLLSVVSTLSSVFVTVQFGLKALSYLFMPLVLTFLAALACMSYLGFDVWAIAKQVIDWNIWFFSGEGMIYGAALIFLCVAGILWLGSRTAPNKAGGGVVASNKHKYVVVSDDGARALAVALHRMGEIARDETVRDAKSSPVGDVEGDIRMVQAQTRPTKGGYKHTHISEGTAEHGEEKGTYSANKPSGVAEVGARSLQSHRSVQEMRHRDTGVARLSADAYAQRTDTHAHTAQDASTYRDTDGADYTGDGKGGS